MAVPKRGSPQARAFLKRGAPAAGAPETWRSRNGVILSPGGSDKEGVLKQCRLKRDRARLICRKLHVAYKAAPAPGI